MHYLTNTGSGHREKSMHLSPLPVYSEHMMDTLVLRWCRGGSDEVDPAQALCLQALTISDVHVTTKPYVGFTCHLLKPRIFTQWAG